jgi:aminoglycoside phosphotransferase (APT) family kinase protein
MSVSPNQSAPSYPMGMNGDALDSWFESVLRSKLGDSSDNGLGPFRYELIAGGRSNLTYRVEDSIGNAYVLRRPPLGHLLPSAHDMEREFRIISALGPTEVPVARAIGLCDDSQISDRPFYVMEFKNGHVLRSVDDADAIAPNVRPSVSASLIAVLGDLHGLDVDSVGLGQLGKRDGYIERQLGRWHRQFTSSKLREVPLVDEVFARLSARIPTQQTVSIVHGDYRLDNTIIGDNGQVTAVLDWEICTLGDPLADVGVLIVYSPEPNDPNPPLGSSPTMAPGFASQKEMLAAYEKRSGLDMSDIGYYVAFANWKLACILDGVYTRYKSGAMANDGFDFEQFNIQVSGLAQRAHEALENA